jgi:hypothetical protein
MLEPLAISLSMAGRGKLRRCAARKIAAAIDITATKAHLVTTSTGTGSSMDATVDATDLAAHSLSDLASAPLEYIAPSKLPSDTEFT